MGEERPFPVWVIGDESYRRVMGAPAAQPSRDSGASNVPVVTSDARGDPVPVAGNAALEVVVGSRRRRGLRAGGESDSGGSSNRPHRDLTRSSPDRGDVDHGAACDPKAGRR